MLSRRKEDGVPNGGPLEGVFFVSEDETKNVLDEGADFVVIGSGFCALAVTREILALNQEASVLVVEAGHFLFPTHFQNLEAPMHQLVTNTDVPLESFLWKHGEAAQDNPYAQLQRGQMLLFGGRSTMWSGWSPLPTVDELVGWPEVVKKRISENAVDALDLLCVERANQIDTGIHGPPRKHPALFGPLQNALDESFNQACAGIDELYRSEPAALAVDPGVMYGNDYSKFSTPPGFFDLLSVDDVPDQRLKILIGARTNRLVVEDEIVVRIETAKGPIQTRNSTIILAAGALANTIIAETASDSPEIGSNYSGHTVSEIVCRVPRNRILSDLGGKDLQLSATYVAGRSMTTGLQFHLQVTGIQDPAPDRNRNSAARHMPDIMARPTSKHLEDSLEHVVISVACVGEMESNNAMNRMRFHDGVVLDFQFTMDDIQLWNEMEASACNLVETAFGKEHVEYWQPNVERWGPKRPESETVRKPGLVHEAGTLRLGIDDDAPVDLDYRLRGTQNVYVTGSALWPRNGSWNPTPTMVALSLDLTRRVLCANVH